MVTLQQNDIIRPAAAIRPAATNDRNAAGAVVQRFKHHVLKTITMDGNRSGLVGMIFENCNLLIHLATMTSS